MLAGRSRAGMAKSSFALSSWGPQALWRTCPINSPMEPRHPAPRGACRFHNGANDGRGLVATPPVGSSR